MIDVYIASAGAGKTHRLTGEYLKLALRADRKYQNIQAVTFTNKATAEMKHRILQELSLLSKDPTKSPYYDDLKHIKNLKERSEKILKFILDDYDHFRVRTIDSFFQEILRQFFRELDLPSNWEISLNDIDILDDAILRIMYENAVYQNTNSARAMKHFAEEQIKEGKGHNLRRELAKLGAILFREDVKKKIMQDDGKILLASVEEIEKLKKNITEKRLVLKDKVKKIFDKFENIFSSRNIILDENLFSHGRSGALSPFYKFAHNPIKFVENYDTERSKRFAKYVEDSSDSTSGLILKSRINELSYLPFDEIKQVCIELDEVGKELSFEYNSINAILGYINQYSLLSDINRAIEEISKETNRILIGNTPNIIKKIIENSDVLFIYEKIGVNIHHHMIDEFQDTSALQYENFKPLLEESLASNNENLIVGDVKQSIYRFRNSDSNILSTQIDKDFGNQINTHNMECNWRSRENIINFNNNLYEKAVELLNIEEISHQYKDLKQKIGKAESKIDKGAVVIHHYEGQLKIETDPEVLEARIDDDLGIAQTLINIQKRGYKASDIAILVRSSKDAEFVIQQVQMYKGDLEGASLDIVSEEALSISNSAIINLIIYTLKYISRPYYSQNEIVLKDAYYIVRKERLGEEYFDDFDEKLKRLRIIGRKYIYEALQDIIHLYDDIINDNDSAYILSLLSLVEEKSASESFDIETFLSYWQERGYNEKIVLPANENAINMMTIHKSKGLGFPVVLLPVLKYDIEEENTFNPTILFNKNSSELLDGFNYPIPVKYDSSLENSIFAEDYKKEQIKKISDSINLLYVATTRAMDEMHIWLKSSEKSNDLKNIGDLVSLAINDLQNTKDFNFINIIDEKKELSILIDSLAKKENKREKTDQSIDINKINNFAIENRLAILQKGLEYFEDNSNLKNGNIMHHILSNINTKDDIDIAISKAIKNKEISEEDLSDIKVKLLRILDNPIISKCFDSSYEMILETPLIGGYIKGSKRPDRVVINENEKRAIVLDYKFGHKHRSHFLQVAEYMKILRDMGYDTEGFLYYAKDDEVIQLNKTTKKAQ